MFLTFKMLSCVNNLILSRDPGMGTAEPKTSDWQLFLPSLLVDSLLTSIARNKPLQTQTVYIDLPF